MNPLNYTLYTLNAKQFLVEPKSKFIVRKTEGKYRLFWVVFVDGV